MLTSEREIQMVHTLLDEAREDLNEKGQAYDPEMPLGGMIEVPAAALAIEDLGRHLDFLSVGTNDLLQYALAADRLDEQVAHLYDMQHPGVIRLLQLYFPLGRKAADSSGRYAEKLPATAVIRGCYWRWACENSACIRRDFSK